MTHPESQEPGVWARLAERRWLVPAIVVLGVALHLPALRMGFYVDDYLHQWAFRGAVPLKPWSLFDFGCAADWADVQGSGSFPWWASPDWKVRFLRPVASLSIWLDHALFGENALGYHVTSLVLYALTMVLVFALYRTLALSRSMATLALLLFACSSESALPVAWIANRNSLLAVLFTAAAVCAVARHRALGRGPATALALACAALATLSKESGVAAFLLVGVFAWRERWVTTVPDVDALRSWGTRLLGTSFVVAALYAGYLMAQGYGTDSLFYSMPVVEPGCVRQAPDRARDDRRGGARQPAVDRHDDDVPAGDAAVRADRDADHAGAHGLDLAHGPRSSGRSFLALWVALTLLPQASSQVSDRLLFGASVGTSALLAVLLLHAFCTTGSWKSPRRWLAAVLFVHVVPFSAPAKVGQVFVTAAIAEDIRRTALGADIGPAELGPREAFVLQARNAFVPFAIQTTYAFESDDPDVTFRTIQAGRRGLVWTREDERTCTFEALGERAFVDDPFEIVYLSGELDTTPGTIWDEGTFTVESVAADERGLRTIRVRFDASLDTPQYRFLVHRDGALRAVDPPAVGETLRLEEVSDPPF